MVQCMSSSFFAATRPGRFLGTDNAGLAPASRGGLLLLLLRLART